MHLTNELSTIYWISKSSSQSISLRQRVTKRVALGRERKIGLALARTTNRKVPAAFPQAPVLTVSMLFSNAI